MHGCRSIHQSHIAWSDGKHGVAKVGEASQGEMRAEKLTIYFQSSTKSTSNKVNKLYLPALLFLLNNLLH
jgi:hypothetical protein